MKSNAKWLYDETVQVGTDYQDISALSPDKWPFLLRKYLTTCTSLHTRKASPANPGGR